jgi:hypothetical protein
MGLKKASEGISSELIVWKNLEGWFHRGLGYSDDVGGFF